MSLVQDAPAIFPPRRHPASAPPVPSAGPDRFVAAGSRRSGPGLLPIRAVLASLAASLVPPAPAVAEQVTPLLAHALPNAEGKALTAVTVEFPPRGTAAPHRHGQAFVYAYVLSGKVRSQLAGEPARTYAAGQSWFEPPGARHLVTENPSATTPARLLVVFVADAGQPLKTPYSDKDPPAMQTHSSQPSVPPAGTAEPAPQEMVDALHSAFGDHHVRAVHAKGIMATGTFEPTPEARQLSRANLFADPSLPVLARFSDFTGIPDIPDTAGAANPRGFALKFTLPDGSTADVVAHSFNGFPTATSAEFRELLLTIGASGPDAAKPTALDKFLAAHPIARTFLTTQKPAPVSYATASYFGVNAFTFTDAKGQQAHVRYRFLPLAGEAALTPDALATKGPDYLQTELPQRLAAGPVSFAWYAQVAEGGDALDDPSRAWPESRRLVKLGVVHLQAMAPDAAGTDHATMFSPLNVPDGISAADPMLEVRQGAYPISFEHRQ